MKNLQVLPQLKGSMSNLLKRAGVEQSNAVTAVIYKSGAVPGFRLLL
ncbi:hypothetical protein [Dysosmobacter sp.]